MSAAINKGNFKTHITNKRHTIASTKYMPTYGTDYADVKTTLPDVPAGAHGEIHVVSSWCDIEKLLKLMDP